MNYLLKTTLVGLFFGTFGTTIGGIIGGFTGAKLLNKIPDKYLKLAFAIFLIYAGWKMLF